MNTLELDQRLALLSNPDFIEYAEGQGKSPQEALNLPEVLSRALLCVRPVFLNRLNPDTGETDELRLPCGTANTLKCPACAEFSQRLRQRQIIRGFEQSTPANTRVLLLTNTAPSFGRVHRAAITPKDEFKVRHLYGAQKEKALLTASKQKDPCPCGKRHRWDNPLVGTPVTPDNYRYAEEIIWSENLPALLKSMTRRLRYLARAAGVPDDALGLFTVFERQRRGSLHTHTLLVVRGHNAAFEHFKKNLKEGWADHLPTAQIPAERLAWYHSPAVANRWKQFGAGVFVDRDGKPIPFNATKSIPVARWKGRTEDEPATTFGENYDLTEVKPDESLEGIKDGNNGFQQAAGYISKYLTKNQQATALDSLKEMQGPKRLHFTKMRTAAGALTLDRIVVEATIRAVERAYKDAAAPLEELEAARLEVLNAEYTPDTAAEIVEALEEIAAAAKEIRAGLVPLRAELDEALAAFENPAPSPLIDRLYGSTRSDAGASDKFVALDTRADAEWRRDNAKEPLELDAAQKQLDAALTVGKRLNAEIRGLMPTSESSVARAAVIVSVARASRGIAIRINRALDNAGFTGSLTAVSRWGCSLTDLKAEMSAYMEKEHGPAEETQYEYELNPVRMAEVAWLRNRAEEDAETLEQMEATRYRPPPAPLMVSLGRMVKPRPWTPDELTDLEIVLPSEQRRRAAAVAK